MFYISYNSSTKKVIWIDQREWVCRKRAKGMSSPDYNEWVATIVKTDEDGNKAPDFSGETGYEIVRVDVDYEQFKESNATHIVSDTREGAPDPNLTTGTGKAWQTLFCLKWDSSKKEVVKDDDALTEFNKSVQWIRIRAERDRLLAETDWMMLSDTGTVSTAWKNYRKALREIPSSQDSVTKFKDITWPSKPS